MQTTGVEDRKARPGTATFVIAKTTEGYRVCSPLNPATQYVVSGIPNAPCCTCSDFASNAGDPEWLCDHIIAVLNHVHPAQPPAAAAAVAVQVGEGRPGNGHFRHQANGKTTSSGIATMVIKRSVSPDGRIDSLSVEFNCPIGNTPTETVKSYAEAAVGLQAEIVAGFLKTKEKSVSDHRANDPRPNGAMPARLLKVDGMDTKWGRRLFISVETNGQTLRLFGNLPQLSEAVKAAGFAGMADRIAEGMTLDLPCLAITKPSTNGQYMNVERVMPTRNGA